MHGGITWVAGMAMLALDAADAVASESKAAPSAAPPPTLQGQPLLPMLVACCAAWISRWPVVQSILAADAAAGQLAAAAGKAAGQLRQCGPADMQVLWVDAVCTALADLIAADGAAAAPLLQGGGPAEWAQRYKGQVVC